MAPVRLRPGSLDDAARAGLERALEASGLLDARLDETGALRAAAGHVLLTAPRSAAVGLVRRRADSARRRRASAAAAARRRAAPAAAARRRDAPRTLADVLSAPDALVPVLAAVAVVDADARGALAVGLDGSFALGPLRGRGADGPARFIGADARQAARERRSPRSTPRSPRLAEPTRRRRGLADLAAPRPPLEAERATLPARESRPTSRRATARSGASSRHRRARLDAAARGGPARRPSELAEAEARARSPRHRARAPARAARASRTRSRQLGRRAPRGAREAPACATAGTATHAERYERHARLHRAPRARAGRGDRRAPPGGAARRRSRSGSSATAGAERDDVLKDAKALDAALAQLAHRRAQLDKEARAETGNMERLRRRARRRARRLERRLRRQDARAARARRARRRRPRRARARRRLEPAPWDAKRITSLAQGPPSTSSRPRHEVTANAIYREFDALRATLDASLGIEAVLERSATSR